MTALSIIPWLEDPKLFFGDHFLPSYSKLQHQVRETSSVGLKLLSYRDPRSLGSLQRHQAGSSSFYWTYRQCRIK